MLRAAWQRHSPSLRGHGAYHTPYLGAISPQLADLALFSSDERAGRAIARRLSCCRFWQKLHVSHASMTVTFQVMIAQQGAKLCAIMTVSFPARKEPPCCVLFCKADNPQDATFCGKCGSPLSQEISIATSQKAPSGSQTTYGTAGDSVSGNAPVKPASSKRPYLIGGIIGAAIAAIVAIAIVMFNKSFVIRATAKARSAYKTSMDNGV